MAALPRIGLRDQNFGEQDLADDSEFLWDRECRGTEIVVFTDFRLPEVAQVRAPVRCAWLVEPPENQPAPYQFAIQNEAHFDYVFTHVKELLRLGPKFVWYPFGGCWIPQDEFEIPKKTKNVSIIASAKTKTGGHRLRHAAIERLGDRIEGVYGRAYEPLPDFGGKAIGMAPFRYSLAIENSIVTNYFTEKLLDCFAMGCVPLYWGSPDVTEFFDPDGIIFFKTLEELEELFDTLGPEDYERRLPAIRHNLEAAREFSSYNHNLWKWALKDVWERRGAS